MGILVVAAGLMAALGVGLAAILALANSKLHVFEDPRVDAVDGMLPHANCGACGFAGCRALAERIVAGEANPAQCTAASADAVAAIAALLGVQATAREKRVARLACAGGNNVARRRAFYEGIGTCRAATLVNGGDKKCAWGCLGFGDCAAACPFDAIVMNEIDLPVVDEGKCTACGECVLVCPKRLFSLHLESHRLWVACKSRLAGRAARDACNVACIACGLCAKDAPEGLIAMRDNLPVVDYSKNHIANLDAIQRCPTGAIIWLDKDKGPIRGAKARPIAGTEPLSVG